MGSIITCSTNCKNRTAATLCTLETWFVPDTLHNGGNNNNNNDSNEKLKEKFGSGTRKTFDRFTTKDSYNWNITHNTESTAV